MGCFFNLFKNGGERDESKLTKSVTVESSNSKSQDDREPGRSGPEFSSRSASASTRDSLERSCRSRSVTRRITKLRVFAFSELKTATNNFSRSAQIGEGGFGCVYKGFIRSSNSSSTEIEVAVKQLTKGGFQGHKEWVTEVDVLGIVEHPNLVKLLGYCVDDDERGIQRLLVYEFMPNGSVRDHLSARSQKPFSWTMRLQVARDTARGLAYLHEGMQSQVILRDFKSSNILLDEHWNAKLSDFGLARFGPTDGSTHISTAVAGTMGYAAPEYARTGRLSSKNDVWSYGVFIFELITGRPPLDRKRPKQEQKLLDWIKPYLRDMKKFERVVDPMLQGNYHLKSVQKLAVVAHRCLGKHPKSRPKMSEVLEAVTKIVDGRTEVRSPMAMKAWDRKMRKGRDEFGIWGK